MERFGIKKGPGALHEYIDGRGPCSGASERCWWKELGGNNGHIKDDGLRFVAASPSDLLEFRIKQKAWERDAASAKIDDLYDHNAT